MSHPSKERLLLIESTKCLKWEWNVKWDNKGYIETQACLSDERWIF